MAKDCGCYGIAAIVLNVKQVQRTIKPPAGPEIFLVLYQIATCIYIRAVNNNLRNVSRIISVMRHFNALKILPHTIGASRIDNISIYGDA